MADREPQPTDGPDYPHEHAAWRVRVGCTCSTVREYAADCPVHGVERRAAFEEDLEAATARMVIGLERMLQNPDRSRGIVKRGPMVPVSRTLLEDARQYREAIARRPADRIDWPDPFPWVTRTLDVANEARRRVVNAWSMLVRGYNLEDLP